MLDLLREEDSVDEDGLREASISHGDGVSETSISRVDGVREASISRGDGVREASISRGDGVREANISRGDGVRKASILRGDGVREASISRPWQAIPVTLNAGHFSLPSRFDVRRGTDAHCHRKITGIYVHSGPECIIIVIITINIVVVIIIITIILALKKLVNRQTDTKLPRLDNRSVMLTSELMSLIVRRNEMSTWIPYLN